MIVWSGKQRLTHEQYGNSKTLLACLPNLTKHSCIIDGIVNGNLAHLNTKVDRQRDWQTVLVA